MKEDLLDSVSMPLFHYSLRGFYYKFMRQGLTFSNMSRFLDKSQWYSRDKILEFQWMLLKKTVHHAYDTVPFYRQLYDSYGITPDDIKEIEDIKLLPFVTKRDLQLDGENFVSGKYFKHFLVKANSSGTTGTPLKLFRNYRSINWENAFIWRLWGWGSFGRKMKRVTIRGDMVVKADQMEPPFGVYNLAEKQLILSSYHLSERNMPWYIAAIRKFSPDAIQAYPSSIFALAGYMAEMNLPPLKTGAIFTSSEMLLEKQKEMIQRYFGSKVYDHYGNAERNVMFGTCEKGQYHVMPEYGFTEFLPVKGNKELYEIVGTSFINSAMPLIRYRTGDMVELGKSDCECGRAFQVVKRIIGRHDDLIVTPDGRKLGRLDHIFKEINGVHKAQIIQEKDYSLVIRVIPLKNYSKQTESDIKEQINKRIGKNIPVMVRCVSQIPGESHGKFRFVISRMEKTECSPELLTI